MVVKNASLEPTRLLTSENAPLGSAPALPDESATCSRPHERSCGSRVTLVYPPGLYIPRGWLFLE